ncbi:hypothetical protein ACU635_14760 [[Actinomadura] parvosata]|uniref:hypothetical protein n=1 Tax=[Actinomadura] parvosata TaxID=1955412 RepID=UPI00406CC573
MDRALDGAGALFWLMPAAPAASSPYEAYVTASIRGADAVARHAVPRVVIVSALGRGSQIYAGHVSASHAMEDLFRSTGAHVRALAVPTFMGNLLRQTASIRDGVVCGTLPAGFTMPWIATKDIAAILTDVLGTPVRYEPGDRAAVKRFLLSRGFSEAMAQSMIDMDLAGERGVNNALPRTAARTTPTTFRAFAEESIKPALAGRAAPGAVG